MFIVVPVDDMFILLRMGVIEVQDDAVVGLASSS